MTNSQKIKKLVGLATLTALVVGLQFLSNYVSFGSVSITLALIPVAVGAILYGPLAGLFLGAVMGGIALAAPSTLGFLQYNVGLTILLCLVKTSVAGLVSGLLFKLFANIAKKQSETNKKKMLFATGIIVAALVVPVINTGIFIVGATIIFNGYSVVLEDGSVIYPFASLGLTISAIITANFLIEFLVSAILSPALVTLVQVLTRQNDLGFQKEFQNFIFDDEDLDIETVSVNA
ncbi:MAG: ECF transporter S component [Acholeplasmatales bacterium]|nr:ECF transporter S component [Acholeplasmatales bacterium]